MLSAFFDGLKIWRPRPTNGRRDARSRDPLLERMEDRRLLSSTRLIFAQAAHVTEGTGGTSAMTFTVRLDKPADKQITVDYRTVDRSADSGLDYRATKGELTFARGEMVKKVQVPIIGDAAVEQTEAFWLFISGARNARIVQPLGTGSILDDDAAVDPEMSINDVSIRRGYSGQRTMTFTVSLNTTLDKPVTVRASTKAITAKAGVDFEAKTQTLTFRPGVKTMKFNVTVYGTSRPTSDKILYVELDGDDVSLDKETGGGVIRFGA